MSSVGDICAIHIGAPFESRYFCGGGHLLVRGDSIGLGSIRRDKDLKFWPEDRYADYERFALQEGDLVLAMDATVTRAGEVRWAEIGQEDLPALLVQRVARISARDEHQLLTGWIRATLARTATAAYLSNRSTATVIQHISGETVRNIPIPLPPLAEQRRIVAALEQAERAVEAAARHAADAETLLRSTIEDGVTARDLPARWEIAALGEAAAVPSIKPKPFTGNRPYFATGAVDRERIGHPVEVSFERRPGRADCEPEINDFGFARMKGARKFIRTDDDIVTSLFSTGFSFWRAGDKADPAYLHYVTRSEAFQQAKDSASSEGILGGATDRQIAKISIPLPPLDEQQAIVARIEKVESAVRAAEAHLERLRALRSSLLENLVSGRVRLPEIETAGSKVAA
jgi:type I restriction enzyme S subunit